MKTKDLAFALAWLSVLVVLLAGCAPSSPSEPAPGATRVREKNGALMVYVPAGWFLMGSTDDDPHAKRGEKPQHRVWLDGYWIDRTEVTNAQYRKFIQDGGYANREYWSDEGWERKESLGLSHPAWNWEDERFSKPDQPVVGVDWYEAQAYARWAGARLPTEAEWEKAARGTDGRRYPWGDEWDPSRANTGDSNPDSTARVGSFPGGASPYGALDMAGNVSEWIADRGADDYYSQSPERNPQGPDSGTGRLMRGGSWITDQVFARCTDRDFTAPHLSYDGTGFRLAFSGSDAGSE